MLVTVTGGKGFLGAPTVAALSRFDVAVAAASRNPAPCANAASLRLDIGDKSTWRNLLKPEPPERLIHLAWDRLDDFDDPCHYRVQFPRHLEFLLWCVEQGIRDITVAGSSLEYGIREGRLREESETEPVTAYGMAKDFLRRALRHHTGVRPFALKWARIFFVRGDDEQEKGVFAHIKKCAERGDTRVKLTWGEQLRDYLPRADVGRFIAHFCLQDEIVDVVNCCSGTPVSVRRMIETYAAKWPELRLDFGAAPYRGYEPMAFWGDRRRMDEVLRLPAAVKKCNLYQLTGVASCTPGFN